MKNVSSPIVILQVGACTASAVFQFGPSYSMVELVTMSGAFWLATWEEYVSLMTNCDLRLTHGNLKISHGNLLSWICERAN